MFRGTKRLILGLFMDGRGWHCRCTGVGATRKRVAAKNSEARRQSKVEKLRFFEARTPVEKNSRRSRPSFDAFRNQLRDTSDHHLQIRTRRCSSTSKVPISKTNLTS